MKFFISFLCALIALFSLVSTKNPNKIIDTKHYNKKLFEVHLTETKSYSVKGYTVEVEMVYVEGSISGKYFNGKLIFEDNSNIIKRFKDGRIESVNRFYVNGTDIDNNYGTMHFEDILVGYDKKQRPITKPNIFTNIKDLYWLTKADVIGVVEKVKNGKLITYKWNKKNTTEKPYRVPEYPNECETCNQRLLQVDVNPGGLGFEFIPCIDDTAVGKFGFTCSVNITEFKGESLDFYVDTRYYIPNQLSGVSARYIIGGVDDQGTPMKIYVENKGVDDYGDNSSIRTEPFIVTDNPRYAWVEFSPIKGTHEADLYEFKTHIFFWTPEGAEKTYQPKELRKYLKDSDSEAN